MKAVMMAALVGASCAHALTEEYVRANAKTLFASFKNDYARKYTTVAEEERRYAVFVSNMLKAAAHEKTQTRGATFGVNAFSDLSEEEFKVYHNLVVEEKPSPATMFTDAERQAKAGSVDWRTKGAVTHVKNQGQCGSCWAFSTTGGIEGQNKLAGHPLTSLSEQELVSCDKTDNGCGGGLMDNAFAWLISEHRGQLVTEDSYPYKSGTGIRHTCESVTSKTVGATISGHRDIAHNEDEMETFVSSRGPLSVAVDATKWQTYTGGVLTDCCFLGLCRLDHGVLIVGYTSDAWIVKNSWGPSWGESGYIRVSKGSNQCGINKSPCTATVN